jgi:hypothetical protein
MGARKATPMQYGLRKISPEPAARDAHLCKQDLTLETAIGEDETRTIS